MPFLRLTRDRRGIENTFLLHADHAGERPRVLYWYRTGPGIQMGRSALDEEAIHTIEDSHPDIEFDWPAILALSEVMTPEDEVAPVRPKRKGRREREDAAHPPASPQEQAPPEREKAIDVEAPDPIEDRPAAASGLLEELVGREIARRLRTRYAEIRGLIERRNSDPAERDQRMRDAHPLNPDQWQTPQEILDGVRRADELFDALRSALLSD